MNTNAANKRPSDLFFDEYAKMEQVLRHRYKIDKDLGLLEVFYRPELKGLYHEYNLLRNIRNLYGHYPNDLVNNFISLKPRCYDLIKDIINKVEKPPRVIDNCVKLNDITYATMGDYVLPYIKIMAEKKYNSIPIIENNRLVGIFRENTLLTCFSKESIIEIDKETTFNVFKEDILIDDSCNDLMFIKPETTLSNLYNTYTEDFKQGKQKTFYFITHDGKKTSDIIGMLTPYRIATFQL